MDPPPTYRYAGELLPMCMSSFEGTNGIPCPRMSWPLALPPLSIFLSLSRVAMYATSGARDDVIEVAADVVDGPTAPTPSPQRPEPRNDERSNHPQLDFTLAHNPLHIYLPSVPCTPPQSTSFVPGNSASELQVVKVAMSGSPSSMGSRLCMMCSMTPCPLGNIVYGSCRPLIGPTSVEV